MRTAGVVVRRGSPETALLLAVAAAVVVLLAVGQALEEVIGFLAELGERSGISPELLVPLYKAVGIALVVRVGAASAGMQESQPLLPWWRRRGQCVRWWCRCRCCGQWCRCCWS